MLIISDNICLVCSCVGVKFYLANIFVLGKKVQSYQKTEWRCFELTFVILIYWLYERFLIVHQLYAIACLIKDTEFEALANKDLSKIHFWYLRFRVGIYLVHEVSKRTFLVSAVWKMNIIYPKGQLTVDLIEGWHGSQVDIYHLGNLFFFCRFLKREEVKVVFWFMQHSFFIYLFSFWATFQREKVKIRWNGKMKWEKRRAEDGEESGPWKRDEKQKREKIMKQKKIERRGRKNVLKII